MGSNEQKTNDLKEVTKELVGWEENKVIRTVRCLTTRPGVVINEYCAGEKQKYLSPVVYFFGLTAIETYLASSIGLFDFLLEKNIESIRQSFSDPAFAALDLDVSNVSARMNSALSFLFSESGQKLVVLPIVLLATWILYRTKEHNLKSTSWFVLYMLGHITLLNLPLLAMWYFTQSLALFTVTSLFVASVYWIWSSMQVFKVAIGKAILLRIGMLFIVLLSMPILQIVLALAIM